MSKKTNKKKTEKYPEPLTYLHGKNHQAFNVKFEGTTKYKLNGAHIEFTFYKGHLVLNVVEESTNGAWLKGDDIDALMKKLRALKKIWLKVYNDTVRVSRCKQCAKVFAGTCAKHDYVFQRKLIP